MERPPGFERATRLARLVKSTLHGRVSDVYLDLSDTTHGVTGVLYDAFVFTIGFDIDRGTLGAGILIEGGRVMTAPFGRRFTLNPDDRSIEGTLAQMDEWARLRLPDKYLDRFEAASAADGSATQPSAPERNEYFAKLTYRERRRVPIQVFRVSRGVDEVYRDRMSGWVRDEAGELRKDRLGHGDHDIWPISRLQAGEVIEMIETGKYHPLTVPGIFE